MCQSILFAQVNVFEINTVSVNYLVGTGSIQGFDLVQGNDSTIRSVFVDGYKFSELSPSYSAGASYHFMELDAVRLGLFYLYSSAENSTVNSLFYISRIGGLIDTINLLCNTEFEERTLALSALYSIYANEEKTWEVLTNVQCGYTEIELTRQFVLPESMILEREPGYPDQIEDEVFQGIHAGISVIPTFYISSVVFVGAEMSAKISLYAGSKEMVDTTMLHSLRYGLRAGVNL